MVHLQLYVNLPGQCSAKIPYFAVIRPSSSLHIEACKALRVSDGVVNSSISQEAERFRAAANQANRNVQFILEHSLIIE